MSVVVATADRRRDEVLALVESSSRWSAIAGKIFTPVPVMGQRGVIRQIKPHQMVPSVAVGHAGTGGFNRITLKLDAVQFDCEENGLEEIISRADRGAYDNIVFEATAAARLRYALLIAQDLRVKAQIFNPATFPLAGNTGLDAVAAWSTVGADVIGDVKAAFDGIRNQSGFVATHMAISEATYRNLWRNTALRASFGTATAVRIPASEDEAQRKAMASALGLQDIAVGNLPASADYDDAAPTVTDVWGTTYAFVYVKAAVPSNVPAFDEPGMQLEAGVGLMPHWSTPNGDGAGQMAVEQYPEDSGRGDVFRVVQHVDEVLTQAALGFLIKID